MKAGAEELNDAVVQCSIAGAKLRILGLEKSYAEFNKTLVAVKTVRDAIEAHSMNPASGTSDDVHAQANRQVIQRMHTETFHAAEVFRDELEDKCKPPVVPGPKSSKGTPKG